MNWDNLNLEQIRQLGVWLKWAEFWGERCAGQEKVFDHWPKELQKLARAQSELRWLYEQKTGNPPHVRDVSMYSVSTPSPAGQAEPRVPV